MTNEQKNSKKSYFFSNVPLWYFKVQKNFAVNHLPLERGLAVQTWTSNRKPDGKGLVTWLPDIRGSRKMPKNLNPEAGESYFQYILFKWNPNDVLTSCKAISKGFATGFVYWSCALRQKPQINGFEKRQKHGGLRRWSYSAEWRTDGLTEWNDGTE